MGIVIELFNFITIILVWMLHLGHGKPLQVSPGTFVSEMFVHPDSLSPGVLNTCTDFVHTIRTDSGIDESIEPRTYRFGPTEVLQDLLNEDWKRLIGKQLRRFTKKHILCKATIKMLKRQNIDDYIEVHHKQRRNNTSLVQLYIQASKISLLLSAVNTDGLKQCCLQDKRLVGLYRKFKNRMVANLYPLVAQEVGNWTVSECYMRASMETVQPMRCEDVTHVITIMLQESAKAAKKLSNDMKRVVKYLEKV